jgi:hypothetical protein
MKNLYLKPRFLTALLLLFAIRGFSLSGVYTINQTIAPSSTNFQSFTAFVTALTSGGATGAITVNVVSGTGPYVEQINIGQITGVSATNSILINGNGNLLTYSSSSFSMPWTFGISGGDFITVSNLNMENLSVGYCHVLHLYNGANNNSFNNCTFSVTPNSDGGYYEIPVVLSGGLYYYSSGVSGNNNTWTGCQMSGGYFGVTMMGAYNAPYEGGNKLINCSIEDFNQYGIYSAYMWYQTFQGCTISRPTRTSYLYDAFGMEIDMTMGTVIEGNRITGLYTTTPFNYNYTYGIYTYNGFWPVPTGVTRNIIRNNIIDNVESEADVYAMYLDQAAADVDHNTISLDYAASGSGYAFAIMAYVYDVGLECVIQNNIISITKGGYDEHYGMYFGGTSGHICNFNDIYVVSANGTDYIGYGSSFATSLSQWQTQGYDLQGTVANPTFSNIANGNFTPTNLSMDNLGTPLGVFTDYNGGLRNMTNPDMGAIEFNKPNCTGVPNVTAITGVNYSICPGESVAMGLNNYLAQNGLTYVWQSSTTSPVGPFTATLGNSFSVTASNITQQTWYSVVITCTLAGGGTSSPVATVNIAGTTTSVVPYLENFEGIGKSGRLPNCSWLAPSLGASQKTYLAAQNGNRLPKSGTGFATFENSQSVGYYYTNGIFLQPGITYSASVWYMTNFSGATNWSSLSLQLGTTQSTTGLVTIASVSPAVSPIYKSLSNTFSVTSAGMYYVAIKAASSAGGAQYLSFDDLQIIVPCSAAPNSPTITLSTPNTTVCSGNPISVTASGASTYTWFNGSNSTILTFVPQISGPISVVGTNTLSGCTKTGSLNLTLKQSPDISVSYPGSICPNTPVNLTASGALTYQWNTTQTGAAITVTPTNGNSSYTVIGTNSLNCSTNYVVQLQVNPTPTLAYVAPQNMCVGEQATLTASGANTYKWVSPSYFNTANPVVVSPGATTTFTLEGMNIYGCSAVTTLAITVDPCLGVQNISGAGHISMYPNPASESVSVLNLTGDAVITISDAAGRLISQQQVTRDHAVISTAELKNGIYFFSVKTAENSSVFKIIKD